MDKTIHNEVVQSGYSLLKSQYELFCKFDKFDAEDYRKLCEHCHKVGIDFMSLFVLPTDKQLLILS